MVFFCVHSGDPDLLGIKRYKLLALQPSLLVFIYMWCSAVRCHLLLTLCKVRAHEIVAFSLRFCKHFILLSSNSQTQTYSACKYKRAGDRLPSLWEYFTTCVRCWRCLNYCYNSHILMLVRDYKRMLFILLILSAYGMVCGLICKLENPYAHSMYIGFIGTQGRFIDIPQFLIYE